MNIVIPTTPHYAATHINRTRNEVMDVAGVTIIPDTWLNKGFDLAVLIMAGLLKATHGKSERQAEVIRVLRAEHDVFRSDILNIKEDLGEIKSDGKEMRTDIKQLLRRH